MAVLCCSLGKWSTWRLFVRRASYRYGPGTYCWTTQGHGTCRDIWFSTRTLVYLMYILDALWDLTSIHQRSPGVGSMMEVFLFSLPFRSITGPCTLSPSLSILFLQSRLHCLFLMVDWGCVAASLVSAMVVVIVLLYWFVIVRQPSTSTAACSQRS